MTINTRGLSVGTETAEYGRRETGGRGSAGSHKSWEITDVAQSLKKLELEALSSEDRPIEIFPQEKDRDSWLENKNAENNAGATGQGAEDKDSLLQSANLEKNVDVNVEGAKDEDSLQHKKNAENNGSVNVLGAEVKDSLLQSTNVEKIVDVNAEEANDEDFLPHKKNAENNVEGTKDRDSKDEDSLTHMTNAENNFEEAKEKYLKNEDSLPLKKNVENSDEVKDTNSLVQNNNTENNVDVKISGVKDKDEDKGDGVFGRVDKFLREALQNPRYRLTILRLELDVQNFMQNPAQQQLEFPHLPTSYLRLAAHRVAQHYCLQSMVVVCNSSDGFGTRIIAQKTSESKYPTVRLRDIPVNLPQEKINNVKFAIKPRPHKDVQVNDHIYGHNLSPVKSVEERNEEYNRARDRIFNSSNCQYEGITGEAAVGMVQCCFSGTIKTEEKPKPSKDNFQNSYAKESSDLSPHTDRIHMPKAERGSVHGVKTSNSRIAIFRDREKDRNDPDYDRSYDRLHRNRQNFDPRFRFWLNLFQRQHSWAPVMHYNSECPPIAPLHRVHACMEATAAPHQPHAGGPWVVPPCTTIGYSPPNAIMGMYGPALSTPAMYASSSQFACPSPAITYAHPLAKHPLSQQYEINFNEALYC